MLERVRPPLDDARVRLVDFPELVLVTPKEAIQCLHQILLPPVKIHLVQLSLDVVHAQVYHVHAVWSGYVERAACECLMTGKQSKGSRGKAEDAYSRYIQQVREGLKAWRLAKTMCEDVYKQRAEMPDASSKYPYGHPAESVSAVMAEWRRRLHFRLRRCDILEL